MGNWPFKLNKQQSKESYLRYKRGQIVEEEKVRRKELHEDVDEAKETVIREVVTPKGKMEIPMVQYREEYEETRDKLEQHIAFGGNIWKRALFSLFSFLMMVVGVSFMGQYTLEIMNQPLPEPAPTVDVASIPKDERKTDSLLADTKAKISAFFDDLQKTADEKAKQGSEGNTLPETVQPTLKYNTQAANQLAFANELHTKIITLYGVIGNEAARYSDRKINLVSLTNTLSGVKLKMAPFQLQIDEVLGEEHPLYANLKARMEGLLENTALIESTSRSQIVSVTNEKINWENTQNQDYITALIALLDAYGIPYTNTDGVINY